MFRLATSKVAIWFLAISLAYLLATMFFDIKPLIDILNGAFLGIAVLVTAIYAPLFWHSVSKKEIDRVGLLAIGIGSLWTAYVGSRAISAYYRNFGDINDSLTNPWIGYFVLMATTAGVLHVVAPGYPPQGIKASYGGRYRWIILAMLAAGIGAAFSVKGLNSYAG